ncbi:MAG: hypothetical protein HRT61_20015, partial [Ekhidna sp.]|nr:hypothetical protein [Ekhidna sp.]
MSYSSFSKSITLLLLFLLVDGVYSQNYSAGINTETPNPNAVLHLVSPGSNQGILIPKLTTAQRNAMSVGSDDKGLMV